MHKKRRMKSRDIKKILLLYHHMHLSVRDVGKSLNKPKSTVADYIACFQDSGLALTDLDIKTTEEIYQAMFPDEMGRPKQRMPKILPN